MIDPILIGIIIVIVLVLVMLVMKMFKFVAILGVIFIILLVMYPRECGYSLEDEYKECECSGFFRQQGIIGLCYGFCQKECSCAQLNQTTGNFTEVECGLLYS